ncbi:hypothetical protein BKA80DRAFT_266085 [Phyllosticta citrichinensis]
MSQSEFILGRCICCSEPTCPCVGHAVGWTSSQARQAWRNVDAPVEWMGARDAVMQKMGGWRAVVEKMIRDLRALRQGWNDGVLCNPEKKDRHRWTSSWEGNGESKSARR